MSLAIRVLYLFIVIGATGFKISDILNAEYLPSTLMIEEAEIENVATENVRYPNVSTEGEIRDAFATMQFHREKMNEYLCRSYVADEILSGLEPKTVARLGIPVKKTYKNHRPQDALLKDQGSSSYRDWLSRSTLLDDVYRHYDAMMDQDDPDSSGTEEVESGEVTGYAVQSAGGPKSPHNWGPNIGPITYGPGAVGGDFASVQGSVGYGGHYQTHGQEFAQDHQGGDLVSLHVSPFTELPLHVALTPTNTTAVQGDEHHYYLQEEDSKGLAVKELFDLALTALAFLAFGLFIMNLIMTCLLGANGTTVVTTMTTVTSTGTAAAANRGAPEGRSYLEDNALNEMAYRVLTSIDELKKLYKGKTNENKECFKYTLCQNNKYSRSLNGAKLLWLPVWSFGISWLVGRLGEDRLSSLKAAVLGLGDADCTSAYPSCKKTSWI